MRARLWIRFLQQLLAAGMLLASAAAYSQTRYPVDLPSQPLEDSLRAIGRITGTNVVFSPQAVRGRTAQAVKGEYTAEEALGQVVVNTPLEARRSGETTVIIRERNGNGNKAEPKAAVEDQKAAPIRGEAIVVTAQKRTELLLDVPVPVTAITADKLVENNQLRIQDYYATVPGLSLTPSTGSIQVLTIRGLTTGRGTPSVGIMVDDVPYGASSQSGANIVPDIDPGDLARVEVLRGPQGTLYGASSIGGIFKFVTVDPSTYGFTGRVQAGINSVHNGAELGYNMRGTVNVPISDTFAVRASGFTRRDPGYIDNPIRDEKGVNRAQAEGGRVAALWRPSDTFSLKLSALLQEISGRGSSDVYIQPGLGDLQQNALPRTGEYDRRAQVYSAILATRLGSADLTAITGYNVNEFSDSFDFTHAFGPLTQGQFGVPGTAILNHIKTTKLSHEARLAAPLGQTIEWMLGGFYTRESTQNAQEIQAADSATGARVGSWGIFDLPLRLEEYAAFGNLTFHVTDRLNIQVGGRQSQFRQVSSQTVTGPIAALFFGGTPFVLPPARSKQDAFTYLVTPQFKISPNVMLYARLASGYRIGGPNVPPNVPRQFGPDKTQNYEVGLKGEFLDRALSIDASLYHIDWKDIQVVLVDPQTFEAYTANAGGAKSRGLEFWAQLRPGKGLTIAAWVAWNDAVLTKGFPPTSTTIGLSGDRLPNSSRLSGNASFDQEFTLTSSMTGFFGGTISYVGERRGDFTASVERETFPAYTKADVRAGVRYGAWTANLFVTNIGDKRGVLNGGSAYTIPYAFVYIRPRTAGLSLTMTF